MSVSSALFHVYRDNEDNTGDYIDTALDIGCTRQCIEVSHLWHFVANLSRGFLSPLHPHLNTVGSGSAI